MAKLVVVDIETWRGQIAEAVAMFSIGAWVPSDIVDLACIGLVEDFDSEALRELAGMTADTSAYDVQDVLKSVADDFEVLFHERDSDSGRVAAARYMARRTVNGTMAPRDLAGWMHANIGHGKSRELERLVSLDDQYDILNYTRRTEREIDGEVIERARELLDES